MNHTTDPHQIHTKVSYQATNHTELHFRFVRRSPQMERGCEARMDIVEIRISTVERMGTISVTTIRLQHFKIVLLVLV